MKHTKIKYYLLALLLVLCSLTVCACGASLDAPTGFTLDENYLLSWEPVEGARSYQIEVKAVGESEPILNKSTRKTSYSLHDLKEGDYEVTLVAKGGKDNDLFSLSSEVFAFHRDYETGCVYQLYNSNTEYKIISGRAASEVVLIEDTYRGKPVTEIAENAFKGNRLITEVHLGKNIRTIGKEAFYNCANLTKVVIPDTLVSLGEAVFQGCRQLTDVNIPLSITEIPAYTFAYCRSLTNFEIHQNVTKIGVSGFTGSALTSVVLPDSLVTIDEYAFSACPTLTDITIGKNVQTIGEYAFQSCSLLKNVTFADGCDLTSIGAWAFSACTSLSEIHLPDGLEDIGERCFYNCSELQTVSLPESITHIGRNSFHATGIFASTEENFVYVGKWLVAAKEIEELKILAPADFAAGTVGIADYVFYSSPVLERVELPASVERIGQYSFAYGQNLWQFRASGNLTTIQEAALAQCTKLTHIVLGDSLETIEQYAFYGCSSLDNNAYTSIVPKSVKKIGRQAYEKTMLWSKPDEYGVIYAGNWVVGYDETKLRNGAIALSQTVVGIADHAFNGCTQLTSIQYLKNCEYIGKYAFYKCSNLSTVVLNTNLKVIEDYTFYKCSSLFQISFPYMLDSIGRSAFYKCNLLNAADFSETRAFHAIGAYAFYNCADMKSVTFSDKIETIGEYAFAKCEKLERIAIPNSLKTIAHHTFSQCIGMNELVLGDGVTTIENHAFNKCASLTQIVIPDGVSAIGKNAFYACTAVESIDIGAGVTRIEDYTFFNLPALRSLFIPSNVRSIGKYAFKGASALTALILPNTLEEILDNAFYGCTQMTIYVESGADTTNWNFRYNSGYRPEIKNVTLSEDKTYVVSMLVADGSITNTDRLSDKTIGINAPVREGHVFDGWETADGTLLEPEAIVTVEPGATLTARWSVAEEDTQAPEDSDPPGDLPVTPAE